MGSAIQADWVECNPSMRKRYAAVIKSKGIQTSTNNVSLIIACARCNKTYKLIH